MKLATVFDAPRGRDPFQLGVSGAYMTRVFDACKAATGAEVEVGVFYAVEDKQPGGKAPTIAAVRAGRERLLDELSRWNPDRVMTVGASALNALSLDSTKVVAISKERGRMRWLWPEVPWLPTISNMAVVARSDLHRDFAHDVYKVLSQAAPIPRMEIDLVVPETRRELRDAMDELEGASVVAVDVETTGLSPYRDGLTCVGFGATYDDDHGLAVVVRKELLAEPRVADTLWDATWRKSRRTVGHNFKFDMQFLEKLVGFAPDGAKLGDTLLLAHLLDERPNRPTSRVRGLGLKDIVAVRYDHQYGFDFSGDPPDEDEEYPIEYYDDLHDYLADDVVYTARLWHDLVREAHEESPRLMEAHDGLLMPVSRAIARAEYGGAPVNVAWIRETVDAYDRRIARRQGALERALDRLTTRRDVGILKPKQVADVMYDDWKMTPDVRKHGVEVFGDRSTDKDHLKSAVSKYLGTKLDRQARWLRSLAALRRDIRQRTTYQKSLLEKVDADGRVRASFLIHGTSTGRLSSQGPNLQNIPAIDREDAIKFRPMRRAFQPVSPVALDGDTWDVYWAEVDYSQLELRVAAAISGDKALRAVFTSGRDIHQEIASAIFSKPYEKVEKAERFMAKAVSFGIIYGRGGKALSTGTEMRYAEQKLGMRPWTEEQADAFIKKFLRDYPTLAEWMERLYDEVPKRGYVESPFGRRRRFPLFPKSRGELGSIQRQGVNTPVQSAASDICLRAMVDLTAALDEVDADSRVLFTVHDSVCLEVPEYEIGYVEDLCREIMEKDFMKVPLKVDFEYGPTWADVEKH